MRFGFPSRGDPTPAMEPLEPRLLLDSTPLITEFMADNNETLLDKFGESSDWIEIYNPTTGPVDLDGWYLTDNDNDLTQWQFPAGVTLAAAGDAGGDDYLVVFASGEDLRDPLDELHTNFGLSRDGEYLALVAPGGQQEDIVLPFPKRGQINVDNIEPVEEVLSEETFLDQVEQVFVGRS